MRQHRATDPYASFTRTLEQNVHVISHEFCRAITIIKEDIVCIVRAMVPVSEEKYSVRKVHSSESINTQHNTKVRTIGLCQETSREHRYSRE